MRTTMNLPDSLMAAVRARAAAEERTVTSMVEEALRRLLEDRRTTARTVKLPTDGIPVARMLVDIDDRDALAAALDADGLR